MAAALLNYPTSEDAQFAKKQDWSYGQPYAPYFEGKQFNVFTGNHPFDDPIKMMNTGLGRRSQGVAPALDDYYAKAALAANRSPLAALGFDPSRTALDLNERKAQARSGDNIYALGGVYNPGTDEAYASITSPSSIVHESIHRGIQKLNESPYWNKNWPDSGGEQHDLNELVVRRLMQTKAGDPETYAGNKQRETAMEHFGNTNFPFRQKMIDDMEAAAALLIAKRKPGGPR